MRPWVLALVVAAGCGAERRSSSGTPATSEGEGEGGGASVGEGEGEGEDAPAGEGEGEGEGAAALRRLEVRPSDASLRVAQGEAATLEFRLVGVGEDGSEAEVPGAAWSVSDPLPGSIDPRTGVFTAGDLGGETTVVAEYDWSRADARLVVRVVRTLVMDDVPGGAATASHFEAGEQDAPELLYPTPGAMLPQNIDGVDFQWRPGVLGSVHRLRFRRGFRDFEVFTTLEHWRQIGGDFWEALVDEGRIGWLEVTVASDGGGVSAPHTLAFSSSEISGAIYYWSTTDGGIMRLPIGDALPERFRVPAGAPIECVGCHSVSRDGFKIAATHTMGIPTLGNLEVLRTSEPESPLVEAGQNVKSFYPTFSPDGTRIVGGNGGVLTERDADTGADLGRVPMPDGFKAIYPDWSPQGDRLVAAATDGLFIMDFGVSAADLWLWDRSPEGAEWLNPRPLAAREGDGESLYYPAWSPDGRFVAFNRGEGASGDDAVDAPLYLIRADAEGEAAGAQSVRLVNAGRASAPPFEQEVGGSWPKWSPGLGRQHLWIAFSSTRPYGHTVTDGPQIWITAIDPTRALTGEDPSFAAFWLPSQNPLSGNHIPYWARYEKE